MADHYTTLGISRGASKDEVKKAWSALVRKYHPDMGPNADPVKFKEVQAAYSVLSSPSKRAAYDSQLASPRPAASRADASDYVRRSTRSRTRTHPANASPATDVPEGVRKHKASATTRKGVGARPSATSAKKKTHSSRASTETTTRTTPDAHPTPPPTPATPPAATEAAPRFMQTEQEAQHVRERAEVGFLSKVNLEAPVRITPPSPLIWAFLAASGSLMVATSLGAYSLLPDKSPLQATAGLLPVASLVALGAAGSDAVRYSRYQGEAKATLKVVGTSLVLAAAVLIIQNPKGPPTYFLWAALALFAVFGVALWAAVRFFWSECRLLPMKVLGPNNIFGPPSARPNAPSSEQAAIVSTANSMALVLSIPGTRMFYSVKVPPQMPGTHAGSMFEQAVAAGSKTAYVVSRVVPSGSYTVTQHGLLTSADGLSTWPIPSADDVAAASTVSHSKGKAFVALYSDGPITIEGDDSATVVAVDESCLSANGSQLAESVGSYLSGESPVVNRRVCNGLASMAAS